MKTTIVDALKDERGTRLTYGNRWLSWNRGMIWEPGKSRGVWTVYEYEYARDIKTQIVCTTEDTEMAVKYLLRQEDENEGDTNKV